jgi:hypothetical protein
MLKKLIRNTEVLATRIEKEASSTDSIYELVKANWILTLNYAHLRFLKLLKEEFDFDGVDLSFLKEFKAELDKKAKN